MYKFVSKKNILIALALICIFGVVQSYSQDKLEQGIAAVKQGDYITAVGLLKSAVGTDQNSYNANLYYGIALQKTGSLAEAEKYLNNAVGIDNERPEAYEILGEVYSEQKKYDDAASKFAEAKKFLPLNKTAEDLDKSEISLIVEILSQEADNSIAAGKVDKAIASLTQAKTYDINNPLIYVGLGDATWSGEL